MGKHFDALVEITRKHFPQGLTTKYIPDVKGYLEDLLTQAALFEFPLKSEEVRPASNNPEYDKYLRDYFDMSGQYGQVLLTPFPRTAIEDPESVVILDHIKDNEYILTSCVSERDPVGLIEVVQCSHIFLNKPNENGMFRIRAAHQCTASALDGQLQRHSQEDWTRVINGSRQGIVKDVIAYVEQTVYIMDPQNFIIRNEHKESLLQDRRLHKSRNRTGKRKDKLLRKTIVRPHYTCLSEKDTRTFLQDRSKEPRPAHPVRGHWKTLVSERFSRKQGQRIFVAQYFTGQGQAEGKNGWAYEVMIKEDPVTMRPYSDTKNT